MGIGLYRLENARDPTKARGEYDGVHLKQCRIPLSEVGIVMKCAIHIYYCMTGCAIWEMFSSRVAVLARSKDLLLL